MTAGLLQPYIPDVSDWTNSAAKGFQLGDTQRQRDVLLEAGKSAAAGNMPAARRALYAGGNFSGAQAIDTHSAALAAQARAASNDQLARALKVQGALVDVAHSIKTPEEFEAAKATLGKAGLDVSKYSFTDLPALQAQALDLKTRLELGIKERHAPEVKEIITNPLTQEKASVQWNPQTGKFEPLVLPSSGQTSTVTSDMSGDQFLNSIDPGTGRQVKAMVEGRLKFPGSFALKTPYWQNMLRLASQYEPNFDESMWRVRSDTRQDAESTKGKTNQAIVAANTAIGHLGQLSDLSEKLDNYSSLGPLTGAANWARNKYKALEQNPSITNFNTVRDKYVEEATKFYRGSGGNEADLKRDIENLQAANSPQQLREAINYHAHLMQSKVNAMSEEYSKVMGQPLDVLHPESRAAVERIVKRAGGTPDETRAAPQQAMPPVEGARQAPDRHWYVSDPNRPGKYMRVD